MKKLNALLVLVSILMSMLLLTSCAAMKDGAFGMDFDLNLSPSAPSKGDVSSSPESDGSALDSSEPSEGDPSQGNDEIVRLPAGMITAAAWNDNIYYNDWLKLFSQDTDGGKFYKFTKSDNSWGYNSLDRVSVSVTNGDNAVAGARVVASDDGGKALFSAVTDAQGKAYLFPNAQSGNITVTCSTESASASFTKDERSLSLELSGESKKLNVIEIMLVVDVTGSMSDEIGFLKAELADVIDRIAANDANTVIKLAMLFYRDTDDSVPFDYYDFTDVTTAEGMRQQQESLNKQDAMGGGDYPEAVDEALNIAVNKQWSTGATTKIIFHVLDAPAHNDANNKEKLAGAVNSAAEKGIRVCPIICSGAALDTEYTMREAAIYTGGTFIFVTDDSGIGGSHHDPDIPNATVELLNSLMVRLVKGYHTGEFDAPIYWKQDPNLATQK